MRKEIKSKPYKIVLRLTTCIFFLLGGMYMVLVSKTNSFIFFRNEYLVKFYGLIAVIVSAYFLYGFLKVYKQRNSALIITNEGLINNTNNFYNHTINWHDIKEIKKVKYQSHHIIVLVLNNENYYLNKISNKLLKFIAKKNSKILGSFVFINANDLIEYTNDELVIYLKNQLNLHTVNSFKNNA